MTQKIATEGFLIDEHFSKITPRGTLIMDPSTKSPYSCILNQTDISKNNNKFYIMQLLQVGNESILHTRYGRVGDTGSTITKSFGSKEAGISNFKSQFQTKTKNKWENVENFVKHKGKYYLINICDKIGNESEDSDSDDSELYDFDDEVKDFLSLISDKKMLDRCLVSMDIDTKKMPLGKINTVTIDKARKVLQNISKNLKKTSLLTELSSEYYTYIPYCSGRSTPPIIDSKQLIHKLEDTLDYLENISINIQIQKASQSAPLSGVYDSINTEIIPLCEEDPDYNIIKKYFINTQGQTHTDRFSLQLKNIFMIHRPEARKRFQAKYGSTPNHQLHIHGSPICNWVSILKNGLMLDPSKLGVAITGKMFGYGIYWANSFSKSAQYCGGFYGSSGKKETICLTLAEVALGKEHQLKRGDWGMCTSRLNPGCSSVWGLGRTTPSSFETLDEEEVLVPKWETVTERPARLWTYL